MWKAVLALTVAALVSGSGLVLAREMSESRGWTALATFDRRHQGIYRCAHCSAQGRLELKPEQEKNWAPVEATIRDMAKAHAERMAARANEQPNSDPVESLHRHAEMLNTVATNLKKLADAEEPLYKSLDDAQKQRFEILSKMLRPHHRTGFAGWHKRGWFGHEDPGQRSEPDGSDNG